MSRLAEGSSSLLPEDLQNTLNPTVLLEKAHKLNYTRSCLALLPSEAKQKRNTHDQRFNVSASHWNSQSRAQSCSSRRSGILHRSSETYSFTINFAKFIDLIIKHVHDLKFVLLCWKNYGQGRNAMCMLWICAARVSHHYWNGAVLPNVCFSTGRNLAIKFVTSRRPSLIPLFGFCLHASTVCARS